MSLPATIPLPAVPIADKGGIVTKAWRYFFQEILSRTGGSTGSVYGDPARVTLSASPFIFTAPSGGTLFLSGGGIYALTISRDGIGAAPGSFYGGFPMAAADTMTIRYVRAPMATFFPG